MIATMLLSTMVLVAPAEPAPKAELIQQVRSAVESLKTLAFEVEIKEDRPKMGRHSALKRTVRLKVFMADGAKFRVDLFQDAVRLATVVSDGSNLAEWDAKQGLWTRYPMPLFDHKYFFKGLLATDTLLALYAKSWVDERGPFGPWLERFIGASETKVVAAHEVRERPCDVVRYEGREWGFPFGFMHERHTLYFDQVTHLLAREARTSTSTSVLLMSRRGSIDTEYLDVQPNAKLPDDIFVFTPPAGSTFVDPADRRFLRAVPVGEAAPDMQLPTVDGRTLALSDFEGKKVVLLTFWATWCGPCIEEMPALSRLHKEFADHDLEIIGVSTDPSLSIAKAFVKRKPVPYTIAHDTDDMSIELYHARSIPHTVLIDKKGIVVKTWQGWSGDEEEEELRQALAKQLGVSQQNQDSKAKAPE